MTSEVLFDVDGVDLNMHVEATPDGRLLVIDPVGLIEREEITRHAASSLIHLIAPDVQGTPLLAGEISLAAAISSSDWVSSHEQYGRNR